MSLPPPPGVLPPPPPLPHKCKFMLNYLVPLGTDRSKWMHGKKGTVLQDSFKGGEQYDCVLATYQDLFDKLQPSPPYTAVSGAAVEKEIDAKLVLCKTLPCELNAVQRNLCPEEGSGKPPVEHWPLLSNYSGIILPQNLIDLIGSGGGNPTLYLCNLCPNHPGAQYVKSPTTYICKPNSKSCHACQKTAKTKEKRGTCEIESNIPPPTWTICSTNILFLC